MYDLLKAHLPDEVARILAEKLGALDQMATKADVAALHARLDGIASEFQRLSAEFKAELHRVEAAIYRWMLTFFATLWLGMAGMIVAIVLKG